MKKILIINNDLDTMELLARWLEKNNYETKFTGNTEEAEEIVQAFKPDLLIVDIFQKVVIPRMRVVSKHTPIILMTGYAKVESTNNLEVDDIIEKPFNLEVLGQKIARLIQ